jgi:pimaricinolide synthase loading module/candicidin polyketide synthase FscA
VRGELAAVTGGELPPDAGPGLAFTELGVTSVTAVELRNRLTAVTGVRLPPTLVFDHPSPAAVARLVCDTLRRSGPAGVRDVGALVDALEALLTSGAGLDSGTAARLRTLAVRRPPARAGVTEPAGGPLDLEDASDEDLFRLMDGDGDR